MDKSLKISEYIFKQKKWFDGLELLREMLNASELEEDVKWGMPTYTLGGKNVIGIAGFKNHFGLWFHNGSFLSDKAGILENAQEGKTKGMRHIKFDEKRTIDRELVNQYILEAIQNQKEGKEIKADRKVKSPLPISEFMNEHLNDNAIVKLDSLSVGKRNEYIEYIENAKQLKTKLTRIEKIQPLIEKGVGLNDMYRR